MKTTMMCKIPFIYGACLLVGLTGCYSTSMMQTAETLKKGESTLTGGLYVMSQEHYADNPEGDQIPGVEVMFRHGIGERLDFGLYYAPALSGGHFRVDMKYNFFNSVNEKHKLSALLSMETENFLMNNYLGYFYAGSGLGLLFSTNHNKPLVPYFYQRIAVGLNNVDVLRDDPASLSLDNYNSGSHRAHYTGGLGIMFQSKNRPRLNLFADLSYAAARRTRFLMEQIDGTEDYSLDRFSSVYLNAQVSFGIAFKIGGGSE
jgi:hypothetical protein